MAFWLLLDTSPDSAVVITGVHYSNLNPYWVMVNKMMLFEWKIRILSNFLSWKIWRLESIIMEMLILILLTLRGYLYIFNYFVLILLNSVLYVLKLCDLKADHGIVLFFPPSTGCCFNKTGEKSWLCLGKKFFFFLMYYKF